MQTLSLLPRRKAYELTFLVPTTYTDSERTKITDTVRSVVGKYAGEVSEVADWGRKYLAYDILHRRKMYSEAYYTHIVFVADTKHVIDINRELFLIDEIMRHLIVIAEETQGAKE